MSSVCHPSVVYTAGIFVNADITQYLSVGRDVRGLLYVVSC